MLASGLAFEREAIDAYRALREKLQKPGRCADPESLEGSLCHLLEEEQMHEQMLADAAAGRLSMEELERTLKGHLYAGFDEIRPLQGEDAERWKEDLGAALAREEKTWIFYGNLGRMSKIPAAKRAFEVLASMEKEHVDILRRLLGAETASGTGKP
ncbi:MAG TPA: ferritin family protein [Spirochaetia bacterium]|nr:ferritin family protein [Spirochaetia bacterium]